MVQLICEGSSCNPALRTVDLAVKAFRSKHKAEGNVDPLPEYLISELHRLVHTPHQPTAVGNRFACTVCGTERKFGSSPWD